MHYIKDVFENNKTQHAHDKFVRYSKGEFVGPLMKIKFSKTGVKVSASFHFTDELLYFIAKMYPEQTFHLRGCIIWNADLSVDLAKLGIKYSKVSKSRGIYKYQVENDVNIKDFMDVMGNYNLLISIKSDHLSLSTKSSFPKPNKEFTYDFCKASFPASVTKELLSEFAFDVKETKIKDIDISHKIMVDEIILPEDVSDFEKARRQATRKGTLYRKIVINGGATQQESKYSFDI